MAVGFGGFLAFEGVRSTTTTTQQVADRYVRVVTTVTKLKLEKVRVKGHVVLKRVRVRVPVVHTVRVRGKSVTVLDATTRTLPGGTKVVTRPVVHYQTSVVRIKGQSVTVKQPVTDTQVMTQTQPPVTITTQHNSVNTVVNTATVTQTETNTETELDTVTVIQTKPVTTTVTETVTEPVTVTVTVPTDTTGP